MNKNLDNFKFIPILISFALISLVFIFNIFYLLKFLGVETYFNLVNKEIYEPWLHVAIYPKNYFKLFYNLSIIFLPLSSILLTLRFGSFIKNAYRFFIYVLIGFVIFMFVFYFFIEINKL